MKLIAVMLSVLPLELHRELKVAVESLDRDLIADIINKISVDEAELGRALSGLMENYDYPSILNMLDDPRFRS